MTLYCETVGSGPDLVLLHGWGMHGGIWAGIVERLGRRFRVHVIDLPGHGNSPPASGGELASWAGQVLAAAPSSAGWVGWSLGGLVAMRAALDAPDRVRTLGLLASTPRFVTGDGWIEAVAPGTFDDFARALASDAAATWRRFLALQVRGSDQAASTLRRLRQALGTRPEPHLDGLAQGLSLLSRSDLRNELSRLACPAHLVLGERDTLVPAAAGPGIAAAMPQATFEVIHGAGHAPFASHADETIDAIGRMASTAGVVAKRPGHG